MRKKMWDIFLAIFGAGASAIFAYITQNTPSPENWDFHTISNVLMIILGGCLIYVIYRILKISKASEGDHFHLNDHAVVILINNKLSSLIRDFKIPNPRRQRIFSNILKHIMLAYFAEVHAMIRAFYKKEIVTKENLQFRITRLLNNIEDRMDKYFVDEAAYKEDLKIALAIAIPQFMRWHMQTKDFFLQNACQICFDDMQFPSILRKVSEIFWQLSYFINNIYVDTSKALCNINHGLSDLTLDGEKIGD